MVYIICRKLLYDDNQGRGRLLGQPNEGLMRTETKEHHHRITLEPGECFAANAPVTLSTLLGSCVAVCLFDPVHMVMGMNHFMLSARPRTTDPPISRTNSGRYGVHAMELLINQMLRLGAEKCLLQAKAFGGGTIMAQAPEDSGYLGVGAVNCRFIREFLAMEGIPLLAEDLGGTEGRVIHFSYGDFAVYMRKIRSTSQRRGLAARDHDMWLRLIEEQRRHENSVTNIDLWP